MSTYAGEINANLVPPGSSACAFCSGTSKTLALALGRRALVKCDTCGLVRQDPMPTDRELSEVYDTGDYYTHESPKVGLGRSDRIRNAVLDVFWNYPSDRNRLAKTAAAVALWPLKERAMPVPFPGDRPVLDIGCGNGQRLLELQSRGCSSLYGVEPTAGAADQARKWTRAEVHTCLLEEAPLTDGHFKLVIMNQVLEHVPSPSATLARVRKLLAADGSLYLTVPNFGAWEARVFGPHWSGLQIPAHLHHFTPKPLRALIEAAGLRITTWRTDTVLAITSASIYNWKQARPGAFSERVYAVPRWALAPATLMADVLGRGQMLRVVAQRA